MQWLNVLCWCTFSNNDNPCQKAKCTAQRKHPALSLKRNHIDITKFVYERKFGLVIRSPITMWNLVCEFVWSHVCAGVFVCVWVHRDQKSGSSALHCSPQGLLLWSWLASKILGCCCLHPSELGLQRGSLACECDEVLDSFPCDYAVTVILPLSQLSHPDPKVLKGEKGFTASPGLGTGEETAKTCDEDDIGTGPRTHKWPKDQSRELSIFCIYTESGLMTKAVLQSRRKQRSNNQMGLRVEGKTGIAHKMKQTAANTKVSAHASTHI